MSQGSCSKDSLLIKDHSSVMFSKVLPEDDPYLPLLTFITVWKMCDQFWVLFSPENLLFLFLKTFIVLFVATHACKLPVCSVYKIWQSFNLIVNCVVTMKMFLFWTVSLSLCPVQLVYFGFLAAGSLLP